MKSTTTGVGYSPTVIKYKEVIRKYINPYHTENDISYCKSQNNIT